MTIPTFLQGSWGWKSAAVYGLVITFAPSTNYYPSMKSVIVNLSSPEQSIESSRLAQFVLKQKQFGQFGI